MNFHSLFKPMLTSVGGLLSATFESAAPMIILTGSFVLADSITAWRLQRRLASSGKLDKENARFSSAKFSRVFTTLSKITGLLVLTSMLDILVLQPLGMPILKFVAGAICFWQAISLLENEAAENDAPWAHHARRFLVDKARRYIDRI